MYCIDASVILSFLHQTEPYSAQSGEFLGSTIAQGTKIFMPEHGLTEVASGIFRATKNSEKVYDAIQLMHRSNISFVPIHTALINLAVDVIIKTGLKASDALYVALAKDYQLVLVTLDYELLEKGAKVVQTRKP